MEFLLSPLTIRSGVKLRPKSFFGGVISMERLVTIKNKNLGDNFILSKAKPHLRNVLREFCFITEYLGRSYIYLFYELSLQYNL